MFHGLNSLELFSGSATVSSICRLAGFQAWSVDNNPKLCPRVCCDILNFDYSLFPGQFQFIWASPDCRYFSRLSGSKHWIKNTYKYRQYNYTAISQGSQSSVELLSKTIEIIDYYKPILWIIENPVGRLRHIKELKYFAPYRYSVNYQDWGHPFAKETDLYTNQLFPLSVKKVQRSGPGLISVNSRYNRSVVPSSLISFLIDHAQW